MKWRAQRIRPVVFAFHFRKRLFLFFLPLILLTSAALPRLTVNTEDISEKIIAFPFNVTGDWTNTQAVVVRELDENGAKENFTTANCAYPKMETTADETPKANEETPKQKIRPNASPEIPTLSPENTTTNSHELQPMTEDKGADLPNNDTNGSISSTMSSATLQYPNEEQSAEPTTTNSESGKPASLLPSRLKKIFSYFKLIIARAEELIEIFSGPDAALPPVTTSADADMETTSVEKPAGQTETAPVEEKDAVQPLARASSLVASDFIAIKSSQNTDGSATIKNAKLGLSLSNNISLNGEVIIYWNMDNVWKKLVTLPLKKERSNKDENGYLYFALPRLKIADDIKKIKIKVEYATGRPNEMTIPVFLDALWIEASATTPETPALKPLTPLTTKKDFAVGEDVAFAFSLNAEVLKKNEGLFKKIINAVTGDEQPLDVAQNTEAEIFDSRGRLVTNIEPIISDLGNNNLAITVAEPKRLIKPGKYTLKLTLYQKDSAMYQEQDFTWGVLAINVDKSVYALNEKAYLQMAALNAGGHTLCDANLLLTIIEPGGSAATPPIIKSGECGPNNVTEIPDYYANYAPNQTGRYDIVLRDLDNNYEIADSFAATNEPQPFVIERQGPTRIFPLADYSMEVLVKVDKNFTGEVVETFPAGFKIANPVWRQKDGQTDFNVNIEENGRDMRLKSTVKWEQGKEYRLTYVMDAPDVSPYLFLLGPLEIKSAPPGTTANDTASFDVPSHDSVTNFNGTFTENRKWQIASDAISTLDPNGDGTINCSSTPDGLPNYTDIDDGSRQPSAPNTSDYISCGVNASDTYDMTSASNVSSTSEVEVWAYYQTSANKTFEIELWDNSETTQYGTTQQLPTSTTDSWYNLIFTNLSLSQSQLDELRIKTRGVDLTGGGGAEPLLYSFYALVTHSLANEPPTVTNVQLNSGNIIVLNPNATTSITATAIVTDPAGYSDISSVFAKIYRSGTTDAENCATDENNCYYVSSCSLSNCADNSCNASCTANIQFHADPTDANTPWVDEYWRVWVLAQDSLAQTAENFSVAGSPEVQSLSGIQLTDENLQFGTLEPGETANPLSSSTIIFSTGNTSLDISLYGTNLFNLTDNTSTVSVNWLTFALATGTPYASSTALSANPGIEVELNIPKTTSSSAKSSAPLWWGFQAPIPAAPGNYSGSITYTALINELPWP